MKKNISIFAMALVASAFTSCMTAQESIVPSKNYVTKKVKVGKFDGISTATSIDVLYTQTSNDQDIEIYAPDNLMEYVKVDEENGMLKIRFKGKDSKTGININGKHKTEVRISAPAVHKLRASSSGDIILKNGLQTKGEVSMKSSSSGDIEGGNVVCDVLNAESSSSGDVSIKELKAEAVNAAASSSGDVSIKYLKAESVNAEASSSGDVILSGVCRSANFSASSSGDVEAKNLQADAVNVNASSAGDITCHAVESLNVTTSTSGNVNYKGNPKHIDYHPKKGLKKID